MTEQLSQHYSELNTIERLNKISLQHQTVKLKELVSKEEKLVKDGTDETLDALERNVD